MYLRRTGTVLGAAALTVLTVPANAHAASVVCGGGASTGRVAVNGCISAERKWIEVVSYRDVTAYVKLRNVGTRALNVAYETYLRTNGGEWKKLSNSRTTVGAGQTVGPVEAGNKTAPCNAGKIEIRVRAQVSGAAWSGWSSAATKQCQT
ncbi:hypothetical protein ACFV9P_03345 [Streptomyces sp. NPDC059892]|uniref:hypothetical protein n=1 Tax=Streptomyces sp. NPDC059892 TaxID=3346989 RepID=UPI003658D39F